MSMSDKLDGFKVINKVASKGVSDLVQLLVSSYTK